jgi:hypothetical protein
MIAGSVYQTLDSQEQKLWHSHEVEVSTRMLCEIKPSEGRSQEEREENEIETMNEVSGLYGKTWHAWQVDRRDKLLGRPLLMGSITHADQIGLDSTMENRNREYGVDHKKKAENRAHPGVKKGMVSTKMLVRGGRTHRNGSSDILDSEISRGRDGNICCVMSETLAGLFE